MRRAVQGDQDTDDTVRYSSHLRREGMALMQDQDERGRITSHFYRNPSGKALVIHARDEPPFL
jgi:hypothetical protein